MKIRIALLYKLSKEEKVARAGIEIYSGRKWEAFRELQLAEERLREKAILGTVAKVRVGLGFFGLTVWINSHTKVSDDLYRMKIAREKMRLG